MKADSSGNHIENRLAEKRRALVLRFCDLPDRGSPLTFQRDLAAELLAAETDSANRASGELSRHKRLIRTIGDGLAFSLLPQHTIRTLGRHPGGPNPSMVGQREDFMHVVNIAERLSESGYMPLLCDVTNLLRVGDIVAVAEKHVLVLECKRSPLPSRLPGNGRLARQRLRGSQAAQYLRESQIVESDAVRQATSADIPEPRWQVLADLANRVSRVGDSAIAMLDDGDAVALTMVGDELEGVREVIAKLDRAVTSNGPAICGTQLDVLSNPRWNCPPPLVFPVELSLRHALLEGNALMIRLVDSKLFAGPRKTASGRLAELRFTNKAAEVKLSLFSDNQSYELGPWFLDRVMHTPTPAAEMRDAILSYTDAMLVTESAIADKVSDAVSLSPTATALLGAQPLHNGVTLAEGDDVAYGTVYMGSNGDDQKVVYEVPSVDFPGRFHIAWDPTENKTTAVFVDGVQRLILYGLVPPGRSRNGSPFSASTVNRFLTSVLET